MEDSLFATVILPISLAIIMVSLGLSLTPADFKRVFVLPRGVAIGLANLFLVSPLLAFVIAKAYSLDPALAVGLVLLGASPGGTTANLLVHLARGDTALSITMTAISSVAAVITVPLYLSLATDHFGYAGSDDVSMASTVVKVLLITVIPLAIGMYIRSRSPERTIEVEPRVKQIAMAVFVLVVIGAIIAERERIFDNFGDVALAALTLNVAAMAVSFTISRLARLDNRQSTAIAIELGVHNSTLAIAVGAAIATELTVPAAVYSLFMFATAGLFARMMFLRNREPAPAG